MFTQTYERDYEVMMDIVIRMNLDRKLLQRSRYNFFDLMSDMGGILGLLFSVVSTIVSFWNYNHFDNYLAQHLFKIKQPNGDQDV